MKTTDIWLCGFVRLRKRKFQVAFFIYRINVHYGPLCYFTQDYIFASYSIRKSFITMDLLKNIGIEIVRLRNQKNVSQERLALNANVDRRYMSDIENGRRNISVEMLSKIAKALNTTGSEILKVAEKE